MPRPRDAPGPRARRDHRRRRRRRSIAYHLAQLGERDVVLLDRNELTSGSTFHSAGLVGQLRGSVSLTRMMMDSVELYRTLDCGWVRVRRHPPGLHARARAGDPPPGRVGADVRAAARADLGRGGAGALPADGHRRRARRLVPADRRLPRSLAADLRAGREARERRRADLHAHARERDRRRATARVRGVRDRVGRGSSARSSSTPAGCTPRRSGGWRACACRSSRSRTSTS